MKTLSTFSLTNIKRQAIQLTEQLRDLFTANQKTGDQNLVLQRIPVEGFYSNRDLILKRK